MLLAGLAACGHDTERETPVLDQAPPTLTVVLESLPAVLPVDGTVQGVERAVVSTRLMARITAVEVEVGTRVRAGQVLVRLGVDDITANRLRAEAALTAAQAAEAEAARHAARLDTLWQQDAVARVQRDQAHLQSTQAAAQRAMAEAAVEEVETASSYAAVRAPFDGVVIQRSAHVGALAVPGMPLLMMEGSGAREAVLAVPSDVAPSLAHGGTVTVQGAGGRQAAARIRAIAGGADPSTRTVEVRASLPAGWPTGIAITALVPTGERQGIAIPAAAVVRRGQLTGVKVLTEHGVVLRWVRLGRTLAADGDAERARVEVLSGLQVGERIVL